MCKGYKNGKEEKRVKSSSKGSPYTHEEDSQVSLSSEAHKKAHERGDSSEPQHNMIWRRIEGGVVTQMPT